MLNVCLGQSGLKNWTAGACRGFVVLIKFEAALTPDSAAAGGPAETDISMLYLFLLNYCLDKKQPHSAPIRRILESVPMERTLPAVAGYSNSFLAPVREVVGRPGEGAERGAISLCHRPAFN
jgi:hypothetical protein